jgi:O-antigen/teichoic acid export membrane protein
LSSGALHPLWVDGYPQAGAVLRVLAIGFAAGLPFSTISAALYGLGQHHHVAYSRIAEGIVNLGLSLLLVQTIGPVGVAIGTAVPPFFSVVLYLPTGLPKRMPLELRAYYTWTYLRPLAASVPFVLACWAIERVIQPQTLLVFVVTGTASLVLYVIPCWLLALTAAERSRVLGVVQRLWGPTPAIASPPVVASPRTPE